MVSLAIWIAAALFLGYVGFVVLGLFAAMVSGAVRAIGATRLPKSRPIKAPLFVRTKHDKLLAICVAIAGIILFALIVTVAVYSTTR